MTRRILLIGVAAAVALAGGYAAMRGAWSPQGAVAQSPKGKGKGGAVAVDVAQAVKKQVPVRIDLLGNVTPIAQVAVKTRIGSEITEVHFSDGAMVQRLAASLPIRTMPVWVSWLPSTKGSTS